MNNKLIDGLNKTVLTENGALQYGTTGNYCLDFFSKVASMRGRCEEAYRLFKLAMTENRKVALMTLLWAYDCRGGAGERAVFKHIFLQGIKDGIIAEWRNILDKIPEYGRWDMLVDMLSDPAIEQHGEVQKAILQLISKGLERQNCLCAKWMPRQGRNAERIRNWMNVNGRVTNLTRKAYRQMLVYLSRKGNVVEQKMSANQWNLIDYSKIPSVAMTRYAAAFTRHSEAIYAQYLADVKAGKAKMNMTVAFPHDCARMIRGSHLDSTVIDAANVAYEKLTSDININRNILVMADVSGSMTIPVSGSVTALDVSVGTAICVADHNTGPFAGTVLTFSDYPKLVKLSGTFADKYNRLLNTQDPYGTDFEKAYMAILEVAVRDHLADEDLPETVLVITDMEFNCVSTNETHMDTIKKQFEAAGYKVPELVFWNLNQRSDGFGITEDMPKCAMLSGFSPAVLATVFGDGPIDPVSVMLRTVAVPRYNI